MFKLVSFPRKEGYAKVIKISFNEINYYIEKNYPGECKGNKNGIFDEYIELVGEEQDELFKFVGKYLMNNLSENGKEDIACGDFVQVGESSFRNNSKRLFIGTEELIDFDNNTEDGDIPSRFESIVQHIPLDYWVEGDYSYLVWVNLDPFREECLKNITRISDEIVRTHFSHTYNGITKKYDIVGCEIDENKFIEYLNREGPAKFYRYNSNIEDNEFDEDSIILEDGIKRGTVLFVEYF